MWLILVAVMTAHGLDAQIVPDTVFDTKEACEEHLDWGKKAYPEDYLDGTIAVCIQWKNKP